MPTFPVSATTDLTTKPKRLTAWNFESTVAAGDIKLRDGGVGGPILLTIRCAIGDSKTEAYPLPGIFFPTGCYVQVVAGTVVGSVNLE